MGGGRSGTASPLGSYPDGIGASLCQSAGVVVRRGERSVPTEALRPAWFRGTLGPKLLKFAVAIGGPEGPYVGGS